MSEEPRGILRNKSQTIPNHSGDQLDRQEVIKNTRLNSKLKSESSEGDKIRNQIAQLKNSDKQFPDHLKWDEINLYKTEQEKAATMKIDEPKTPYEGGFDPTGEYYQEDEEIPEFELGESAHVEPQQQIQDDNIEDLTGDEQEEEEKPLTAEERHKKFEEMRKNHYHMKGAVLGKKLDISDDEE